MSVVDIRPISSDDPSVQTLSKVAEILATGKLVVAPTETRYGLLARADSRIALESLFSAKGRPTSMPTAVFARDIAEIGQFGLLSPLAATLASAFLPGPLTLVLAARGNWEPQVVVQGRIGVRWSSSKVITNLLRYIDFPITATSANKSGMPDIANVLEASEQFGGLVELYLDAGELKSVTSTVVDCSGESIRILRPGAISEERIAKAISKIGK